MAPVAVDARESVRVGERVGVHYRDAHGNRRSILAERRADESVTQFRRRLVLKIASNYGFHDETGASIRGPTETESTLIALSAGMVPDDETRAAIAEVARSKLLLDADSE